MAAMHGQHPACCSARNLPNVGAFSGVLGHLPPTFHLLPIPHDSEGFMPALDMRLTRQAASCRLHLRAEGPISKGCAHASKMWFRGESQAAVMALSLLLAETNLLGVSPPHGMQRLALES